MAILRLGCGMFSFVIKYEEYSDNYIESYTYSLKIKMGEYPLFSESIEKKFLAPDGKMIFTSDDDDHLLNAFKKFVDSSSPLDEEIDFYSEVDGPQQVFIKLIKTIDPRYPNLVWYYITFYLESDSFENYHGTGEIQLTTHTIEPDDIKRFIIELEEEREELVSKYRARKQ